MRLVVPSMDPLQESNGAPFADIASANSLRCGANLCQSIPASIGAKRSCKYFTSWTKISQIADSVRPNIIARSPNRHGYARRLQRMAKASKQLNLERPLVINVSGRRKAVQIIFISSTSKRNSCFAGIGSILKFKRALG